MNGSPRRGLRARRRTRPPGPPIGETLQIANRFKQGQIEPLAELRKRYGDIVYLKFPIHAYAVFAPRLLHQVLQTDHRGYRKSNNYQQLRRVMGNGLVTSDGPRWVEQRRILRAAFTAAASRKHAGSFEDIAKDFAEDLSSKLSREYQQVDLSTRIEEVSARLTNALLFGVQGTCPAQLHGHIRTVSTAAVDRIYSPINAPAWIPTRANRVERAAITAIRKEVAALTEAFQPNKGHETVADKLLGDDVHGSDRSATRDQLVTLLLAGQDTVCAALKWYFLCLAEHPEAQRRVVNEVCATHSTEPEDLRWTYATLLEAMRLYPPIPVVARTPIGDQRLGEYVIPHDSVVLCGIHAMHRHPEFWEAPEQSAPSALWHRPMSRRPTFRSRPVHASVSGTELPSPKPWR